MGITRICPIARILAACGVMACGAAPLGNDGAQGGGSKGGDFSDPAIEDRCHESAELSVFAAERHCECLVAAGEHPDQATCVAERSPAATDVDCVCSTYASYPESSAFIDCFIPIQQAAVDCAAEALCNTAKLDACNAKFADYTQCPLPTEAADEVSEQCELP
ncbi:MAG TPA: hypothetical protein VGB85_09430 [Nannocystis sp.]|jgi:hypothetical protein